MRDKIAKIIEHNITDNITYQSCLTVANKILSLLPSLEGIEVEEKCISCKGEGKRKLDAKFTMVCTLCHGTGTITRQAELEDVKIVAMYEDRLPVLVSKSGGRLVIKNDEKD